MDGSRKIGKANQKRKMRKVKKSKRWGGEWTRVGKRGTYTSIDTATTITTDRHDY